MRWRTVRSVHTPRRASRHPNPRLCVGTESDGVVGLPGAERLLHTPASCHQGQLEAQRTMCHGEAAQTVRRTHFGRRKVFRRAR